ncbi:hypothetical protein EDD11_002344 [Mortierella claussenii]|nr:hypothetical protein EDD11_002344 [Mortierella claussenii]
MKDSFKHAHLLVPKHAFTGDPEQAYWISEFDHIAPYAKINERQKKLLLRTRRDMVRTQSGGGFGATVSSSRWHKYGSFSAKLKSGSTGPGIITAFLLSNPALGEEISFEFTGKDPKKVITNYYRRVPNPAHIDTQGIHRAIIHPHPHQHSHLESHEEIHDLKADSTKQEMLYKIEWTANLIRWSVNGKVIRAVQAGNMVAQGGLPENAMQLQLTIWDAGHAPETMAWSGGKSSYGPDDLYEYVASVSSVEVVCQNPKEGNKPWPGPEATKRLKIAKARAAEQARRFRKMSQNKKVQGSESEEGVFTSAKTFFEIAILTLIKWGLILLSVVCGAAYFTTPKPRTRAPSNPSTSKTNLGLQT